MYEYNENSEVLNLLQITGHRRLARLQIEHSRLTYTHEITHLSPTALIITTEFIIKV